VNGATIDVSHLPSHVFGRRSALFWAFVLVTLIEGTAFALMLTSYLFVRGNFLWWPPEARMRVLPGIVEVVILLASGFAAWKTRNATRAEEIAPTRRWMTITAALSLLAVAGRAWEIHALTFPWDANAYASVVWGTYGLHTIDLAAGVFENLLVAVLLWKGPLEDKHFEDIEANAYLWLALVGLWLPFAVLFHLDGVIR
jgi:cytochrome c oxidase subunit III